MTELAFKFLKGPLSLWSPCELNSLQHFSLGGGDVANVAYRPPLKRWKAMKTAHIMHGRANGP